MTDLHDDPDDMTTLDQPATRRDLLELRTELRGEIAALRTELGTELRTTLRAELGTELRTTLRAELTAELTRQTTELRSHFDAVAESFKAEFRNLFDWTHATTESLGRRLDVVERDHGAALTSLDFRVRALEHKPR